MLYSYRYCDKIFTKKGVYESLEIMEHACRKMQKMQAEENVTLLAKEGRGEKVRSWQAGLITRV